MPKKSPPTRYVAFLRGINVGGHRVSMDRLRALFEELKFANVATFIASGNVLFDAPAGDRAKLEARIEAHLHAALGYEVATFLRTPAELAAIAAFRPFADADLDAPGHTVHVAFLRDPLSAAETKTLMGFGTTYDEFRVHGREWYWLCRGRFSDSLVPWPKLVKATPPSTLRSLVSVRKLVAKHPPI